MYITVDWWYYGSYLRHRRCQDIQPQTMGKKDTEIENERKKGRKYTWITLMKRNRTATEQSNCIISRQCWWGPNLLLCIYLSGQSSSHFVLSAALYSVHVPGEYSFLKELTKTNEQKNFDEKKISSEKKPQKLPSLLNALCNCWKYVRKRWKQVHSNVA